MRSDYVLVITYKQSWSKAKAQNNNIKQQLCFLNYKQTKASNQLRTSLKKKSMDMNNTVNNYKCSP